MKGNAALETSARVTFASTSRAFGPGNRQADALQADRLDRDRTIVGQMLFEPAHMELLGDAGAREIPRLVLVAEIGEREIADQPAVFLEHGSQRHAPGFRQLAGEHSVQPRLGSLPDHTVFGEGRNLRQADARPHRLDLVGDMLEIGRATPGEFVGHALGRVPQRHLQPVGDAELRALGGEQVVDRRGLERPPGGQFLVGEADGEAARIVLAHLGVGVGHGRPVTVARDIHRPDIGARIACHHPVRQREPDAAALAETGRDAAGDPETGKPAHRSDQRVAIRREGEGPVDDLLDAGLLEGREMRGSRLPATARCGRCRAPAAHGRNSTACWNSDHGLLAFS